MSCSTRTSRTASSARFSINENGDTTANPVTVYIQQGSGSSGTGKTYKTIVPPSNLVQAG